MRYFLQLSYDGARYHGWQIQPNGVTVEEVVERSLATLLRNPIDVTGAGRTDAGVNASMMVAHFDTDIAFSCQQLADRLNRLLPHDISVQRLWAVSDSLHARFSATSRTYHYYVTTRKDVFANRFAWHVPQPLDFGRMNQAATLLLGTRDFTSFAKVHTDVKTMTCSVSHACWERMDGCTLISPTAGLWRFTITADRFLRNMVRAIVGTLIDVGRGRISVAQFAEIIRAENRCEAGQSVPAHALFLSDVTYPDGWREDISCVRFEP